MWNQEQVDQVSVPPLSPDETMPTPACASMSPQLPEHEFTMASVRLLAICIIDSTISHDRQHWCAENLGLKAKYGK